MAAAIKPARASAAPSHVICAADPPLPCDTRMSGKRGGWSMSGAPTATAPALKFGLPPGPMNCGCSGEFAPTGYQMRPVIVGESQPNAAVIVGASKENDCCPACQEST